MDEKLKAMINIFSLLRKANGLNRERANFYSLNDLESMILIHIGMNEKVKQKTLVNKFKSPKQTINSAIMNLKDKGYIDLRTDEDDKRAKNLYLTPEGELRRREALVPIEEANRAMYEDLGEENVREITKYLNLLLDSISNNFMKEDR
ncbi:MAG: MarR family winged helix-turn-helix transcriptional regulator [Anaerococcus sp.]|uniref:MarR family winged helix-turn-helix transcriptional regulator n=1 Tax=Anaerococcus sp. TaxID=1872515 RepID=UPI0026078E9A|nr:MarR family winged helix-turn-helix transcriptional regulator [Anaerococcus sp.]MCI5972463.1 MarR family winged helix-turn-helix transcriptional regulator [Anaerococcus sp.]MDD6919376.1 MarR family winged helix-turn-helix transcriptional regulator [Peptoniphilaceae bacterium]MDY2927477.1 MarR family winged helix-turn-helix transcriptional regulator [Anaerococcus sp.]